LFLGLGQTWYLSSEMIVFFFTPLMLIPVHRVGRKFGFLHGFLLANAFGIASTMWILVLAIVKDWPMNSSISA